MFCQKSSRFSIAKYRSTVRVEWYFYINKTERTQIKKGGGKYELGRFLGMDEILDGILKRKKIIIKIRLNLY